MERVGRPEAFDRRHRIALMHHRQGQAAVDPPPFDDHRAGAALAMIAALLGAGQVQLFAQGIEQGGAGVEFECQVLAVDLERDLRHNGENDAGRRRGGLGSSPGKRGRCGGGEQNVAPVRGKIIRALHDGSNLN